MQRQAQTGDAIAAAPANTPAAAPAATGPAAAAPSAAAPQPAAIGSSDEPGFFGAIAKLKSLLGGVMSAGGGVIATIVSDPVAFLGNMLGAIRKGLGQFVGNIGTHLKNGLIGWLLGSLGEAGLQMPQSFDAKGILGLVLQVIGLTYSNVRARAVTVIGERALGAAERTVDMFKTLATEGVTGIWRFVAGQLSGLKEMVLGQIQDFVAMRIVRAGVTWLLSMLNPASALVRACMMIYDVVMFFKERGSQIIGVVNAVIGSVGAIASGAIDGAANMVEQALARVLPVALGFLASLLGLGGIADKIKSIIAAVQAPVNKAIDAVVGGAVKLFKRLGGDKLIKAAEKGVTWGKEKIKKGKEWVKGKVEGAKDKFYGGTEEDKQKRLNEGVMAGKSAVERFADKPVGRRVLKALLGAVRLQHRLPVLEPVRRGDFWAIRGEISRVTVSTDAKVAEDADAQSHGEASNQMRVQLQQGDNHLEDASEKNMPKPGVTVAQLRRALKDLFARGKAKISSRLESKFLGAIARSSAAYAKFPPGGVSKGGNFWREEFRDEQQRKTYRVDSENLRGTNLRE